MLSNKWALISNWQQQFEQKKFTTNSKLSRLVYLAAREFLYFTLVNERNEKLFQQQSNQSDCHKN